MKSRKVQRKKLPVHALSAFTFVTGITALVLAVVVVKVGVPQSSQAAAGGNSPKNTPPPVICITTSNNCGIDNEIASHLKGKNLSNAIFAGSNFRDGNNLIDISNTTFQNAIMSDNTDFSSINSNVNFSNDDFTNADFTLMQVGSFVDFTNANFTNANFNTSRGWSGFANVTGVTWSNTTCPDGTNSDNDGSTCVGHGF